MAANGISTLASKTDRKIAKIALAEAKRQTPGTVGFRVYNHYIGTVSPVEGRPWSVTPPIPSGYKFVTENLDQDIEILDENGNFIVTE